MSTSTDHPSSTWTTYMRTDPGPADPDTFYAGSRHPAYPRASAYDPEWVQRNQMGPNALWLIDDLTQHLEIAPAMRVLDLGCGTAMTSIFLAREFGVEVWAADLWVEPTPNLARIIEAEVGDLVAPIKAEAHALPFALGFFDAVVSVDAYQYFGTDVRYLSYLQQFVKPGGVIAVSVPGNNVDPEDHRPDDSGPDDLEPGDTGRNNPAPNDTGPGDPARNDTGSDGREAEPFDGFGTFGADWFVWRSAEWWARLWSRTKGIAVEQATMVPDGRELWEQHARVGAAWSGRSYEEDLEGQLLASGAGSTLGFVRLIARRTDEPLQVDFGPGPYATRLA